jgi:hypothetical protein
VGFFRFSGAVPCAVLFYAATKQANGQFCGAASMHYVTAYRKRTLLQVALLLPHTREHQQAYRDSGILSREDQNLRFFLIGHNHHDEL